MRTDEEIADELELIATINILDAVARGEDRSKIARRFGLAPGAVHALAEAAGPSKRRIRATLAGLRRDLARRPKRVYMTIAPRPPEPEPEESRVLTEPAAAVEQEDTDHPALDGIRRLSYFLRDRDQAAIGEVFARTDRAGLEIIAAMMAAIIAPDINLAQRTEWFDLPPEEWSTDTMWREFARWRRGALDCTALAAAREVDRRANL